MRLILFQIIPKLLSLRKFFESAVDKIARNLPTKSCLLDLWPTILIKECSDILLPSLTKLVKCSLVEGCVHNSFKPAVLTTVLKKYYLPVDDLTNYHSVSGLSFISKLVECLVAKQLLGHIHVPVCI